MDEKLKIAQTTPMQMLRDPELRKGYLYHLAEVALVNTTFFVYGIAIAVGYLMPNLKISSSAGLLFLFIVCSSTASALVLSPYYKLKYTHWKEEYLKN
jgi:hypothetical protein